MRDNLMGSPKHYTEVKIPRRFYENIPPGNFQGPVRLREGVLFFRPPPMPFGHLNRNINGLFVVKYC